MNWEQGLRRVSAVLWTLVALFFVGYTAMAIIVGEKHSVLLYLLLFNLAAVIPFIAHKVTCWVTCWVIRGFTTTTP